MMQGSMIGEAQELKLAGCTPKEVHEELGKRRKKAPTVEAVREHCNMDCVPDDDHAKARKQMALGCEPFASAVAEIVGPNPDCHMGSVYDVLVGKFVEGGVCDALPGDGQTLRSFIHRLEEDGEVGRDDDGRRTYDVVGSAPPSACAGNGTAPSSSASPTGPRRRAPSATWEGSPPQSGAASTRDVRAARSRQTSWRRAAATSATGMRSSRPCST